MASVARSCPTFGPHVETPQLRRVQTSDPAIRRSGETILAEEPLSVAYVCPYWPPDFAANGIVMYLGAITEELRKKGHTTTLLSHRVTAAPVPEGIYDLGAFLGRRTLAGRILDRLERRANLALAVDR